MVTLAVILGRPWTERFLLVRNRGNATRHPGVYRVDDGTFWIRAKVLDPRTGTKKEVERLLNGVTINQAVAERLKLIDSLKNPVAQTKRMRVREYAEQWLESKKLRLDPSTAKTYEDAIKRRILPELGDFYYDAIN